MSIVLIVFIVVAVCSIGVKVHRMRGGGSFFSWNRKGRTAPMPSPSAVDDSRLQTGWRSPHQLRGRCRARANMTPRALLSIFETCTSPSGRCRRSAVST